MTGYMEYDDDAVQYASQNRQPSAAEAAAIERLTAAPAGKQHSAEVERLAKLAEARTGKKQPTSTGQPKVSDNARVRRALDILRNGN